MNFQSAYLRLMSYVMSIPLGLIPAAYMGYVSYSHITGDLSVHVNGLITAMISGGLLTSTVFIFFGVKPPSWAMHEDVIKTVTGLVLRLSTFCLSSLIAAIPTSLTGLVEFIPQTGYVIFHLGGMWAALGGGALISGFVFKKFSWK